MIRPVIYGNTKWRKLALKTEATSLPLFPPVGLRHCVSATPGQTPASSVPFSSMTNASARRLPGSRQPARRCSFTASLRPGGEPWWGQSVPNVLSVMKMRFYSSPVSDGGAWGLSPLREGWGVRRGGRAVSWVGGPPGCPLTTSWLLKRGGDARHGHLLACAEIEPLPATPSGKLTSPTSSPRAPPRRQRPSSRAHLCCRLDAG